MFHGGSVTILAGALRTVVFGPLAAGLLERVMVWSVGGGGVATLRLGVSVTRPVDAVGCSEVGPVLGSNGTLVGAEYPLWRRAGGARGVRFLACDIDCSLEAATSVWDFWVVWRPASLKDDAILSAQASVVGSGRVFGQR